VSPFLDLEDNIANGPILVGSPESVIEKIISYHSAYGNQVLSVSVDGLTQSEQLEQVEWFANEVIPVLRRELPNEVWNKPGETVEPRAEEVTAEPVHTL